MKAASKKDFVIIGLDATSAFFQALIVVPTVGRPPQGEAASGVLWKLNKAMPGLRVSAKAWGKRKADDYTEIGCERSAVDPSVLYHPEKDILLESHGDDAMTVGKLSDIR